MTTAPSKIHGHRSEEADPLAAGDGPPTVAEMDDDHPPQGDDAPMRARQNLDSGAQRRQRHGPSLPRTAGARHHSRPGLETTSKIKLVAASAGSGHPPIPAGNGRPGEISEAWKIISVFFSTCDRPALSGFAMGRG